MPENTGASRPKTPTPQPGSPSLYGQEGHTNSAFAGHAVTICDATLL